MRILLTFGTLLVCGTVWAASMPSTVTCKDGTTGPGGRGACKGHGGVDKTKSGGEKAAAPAEAAAPAPTVTCKDGTTGPGGRGACRGHGGVDKGKAAGASAPAAKSAPAETPPAAPERHAAAPAPHASSHGKAATDDPSGAIAKCKDGMYWHGAGHSGSCSHHGGVESWLDGTGKN